jgi:hypothetical protein
MIKRSRITIIQAVEYSLDGEKEYEYYKISVDARTNPEFDYYEAVKNKTFDNYGEARRFISEKWGI